MSILCERYREEIISNGLSPNFFKLIENSGVIDIDGYIGMLFDQSKNVITIGRENTSTLKLKAISRAFKYYPDNELCSWASGVVRKLCDNNGNDDGSASLFAELEVYGHLKSSFHKRSVEQLLVHRKDKTPDFKVGDDLFVEVYCPDVSHNEIEKTKENLDDQVGPVKKVLSRPITGSEELATQYSTNQVIARVLGAKRENDQFKLGMKNILWVDVKNKMELHVKNLLPLVSLNHADQTYVGCFGIWHSIYGAVDQSIFPDERYTLLISRDLGGHTYRQHRYNGLFRDRPHISGAIFSCLDGNVLFLNPWCEDPLSDTDIYSITNLAGFRPEFSFFVKSTLKADIESKEEMIAYLLNKDFKE